LAEHIANLAALGRKRRHQHTKALLGSIVATTARASASLGSFPPRAANDHPLAGLDQRLARDALVENPNSVGTPLPAGSGATAIAKGVDRRGRHPPRRYSLFANRCCGASRWKREYRPNFAVPTSAARARR